VVSVTKSQYLKKSFGQRNIDYLNARQQLTKERNREMDLHKTLVNQIVESGSSDAPHEGNLNDTRHSRNADALNYQISVLHNRYFTEQEIAAAQREADQNAAKMARKTVMDKDTAALGYAP
jgi:hypothetical protein